MKKLATILALTGVVANLGFATVFADDATGTQVIGCNEGGGLSLSAPANLGFYGRSTNFYQGSDAPLEGLSSLTLTDTRGYGACGAGASLTVQSDGLVSGTYTINLATGTFGNTDLTEDSVITASSPDTLIGVVVDTTVASVNTAIAGGVELISSTEAFYGDVTLALNTGNADSQNNTVLKAQHDNLENGGTSYAGPIPTGSYTGDITFTVTTT